MPSFRWTGRAPNGGTVQGEITARSKDEVIVRLRERQIVVSQITERRDDGVRDFRPPEPAQMLESGGVHQRGVEVPQPRRLRGLLVIAVFVLAAFAVGAIGPVTTWTCERTSVGRVDCAVSERDLGLISIREQTLAGVSSVSIETRGVTQRGPRGTSSESRLVLVNADGQSIRSFSWAQSRPDDWRRLEESVQAIQTEFHLFLADAAQPRISTWGIPAVPLVIIGVLLLVALFLLVFFVLSFFAGPTAWIQAQAVRAQARTRQRRRV